MSASERDDGNGMWMPNGDEPSVPDDAAPSGDSGADAKLRRDLTTYLTTNRAGLTMLRSLGAAGDALDAMDLIFKDLEALLRGEDLQVHVVEVRDGRPDRN